MPTQCHGKFRIAVLAAFCLVSPFRADAADNIKCDLSSSKSQDGLRAALDGSTLVVSWTGDGDQNLRLRMSINGGVPTFDELALRRGDASWRVLARGAVPEYSVTTGLRRISNQQLQPLRGLGVNITQEEINKYRWDPFWDAPLDMSVPEGRGGAGGVMPPVEGVPGTDQPGLPRKADEVQQADAVFAVKSCKVVSDGARLVISYPGVKLGLFEGSLQYTIFKGTNLIRQEIAATTKAHWVAYKYDAGLKGLAIAPDSHVNWRDTSDAWQRYRFEEPANADRVPLNAANRIVMAQQGEVGAIVAFPPPHKFFWARESAVIKGYNWYRKDSSTSYAIGIRQNEGEEGAFRANWALYSARPGTQQLMTMFIYPTLATGDDALKQALAFTRGDHYAPLPGYQVMQHHYHMDLGQRLIDAKNTREFLPDLKAIKALGINIVSQVDAFTMSGFATIGDPVEVVSNPNAPARPSPLPIREAAIEGARHSSDKTFLVMPSQEIVGGPLGGHVDLLFSHPVYWDQRKPGQPFEEPHPSYGKVYHVGNADDFMRMVEAERMLVSLPHPRSKASTGFPDAIKDKGFFHNPRYHGFGFRWGMGLDGSERKTCEYRCLPLLDELTNWTVNRPGPLKSAISISEMRHQEPGDDIYGGSPVTYLRLKELPSPDDTSTVIDAVMRGDMFITTGEVLVPHFEIRGEGNRRTIVADVQWTFPLDQVEIVWGDGKTTGRQTVSATHLPPFGTHRFEIPFDARGKKWVRLAVWDSAYEGAILQPVRLNP